MALGQHPTTPACLSFSSSSGSLSKQHSQALRQGLQMGYMEGLKWLLQSLFFLLWLHSPGRTHPRASPSLLLLLFLLPYRQHSQCDREKRTKVTSLPPVTTSSLDSFSQEGLSGRSYQKAEGQGQGCIHKFFLLSGTPVASSSLYFSSSSGKSQTSGKRMLAFQGQAGPGRLLRPPPAAPLSSVSSWGAPQGAW